MEQEKRQKEITRHGLIRVGLWLGGGWLLLVLCAWGILPDREVPGILWVGLGLLTAELAILWGKTWWESRGRGQAIPARSALVAGREGGAGGRRCDAGGVVGLSGPVRRGGAPPHGTGPVQLAPGGSGDHPLRGGAAALAEREAGPVAGGACHRRAPAVRRPGLFSG